MASNHTVPKYAQKYDPRTSWWVDFGLDNAVQTSRRNGAPSADGSPLLSEGFSYCSGLVMRDVQSLNSNIHHMDEPNATHFQAHVVAMMVAHYVSREDPEDNARLQELIGCAGSFWCNPRYDGSHFGMSDREHLTERLVDLGVSDAIKGVIVRGDVSRNPSNSLHRSLFDYLAIEQIEEIRLDTDNIHWALGYKPKDGEVVAFSRKLGQAQFFDF